MRSLGIAFTVGSMGMYKFLRMLYIAFTVGSMGMYKFLRMLYGLCNAPGMFQHLMQNCLGELNLTYTLIYLDDMIVYSKTERGPPGAPPGHVGAIHGARFEIEAVQM